LGTTGASLVDSAKMDGKVRAASSSVIVTGNLSTRPFSPGLAIARWKKDLDAPNSSRVAAIN
jgi:hypothetical protein